MANDRRHQQRVDAILLDDFTERARILWMCYDRRLYLIGEMPHFQGHRVQNVCIEGKPAAHRVILRERFENQISPAGISKAEVSQPRRAAATQVMNDM